MEPTKSINPKDQPDNVGFMTRFSKTELKTFLRDIHVPPEIRRSDQTAAGIISYLKPIHQAIGEEILNVEKMKALAPEIEQSRILVSSAIMSPNDLQDGEFIFNFDNVPGIANDPDLCKEIGEVYEEFYNNTLDLGIKSYDWIGDIQYSSGSKPVLILPIATQESIKERTNEEARKSLFDFGPGFASIDEYIGKERKDADYFWTTGKHVTWKDVLEEHPSDLLRDMIPSMESFNVQVPVSYLNQNKRKTISSLEDEKLYGKEYVAGLEAMIVNLRTKLEEGDVIRVSENPEILRFATQKKLIDKHEVYAKMKKNYRVRPVREELIKLEADPEGYTHKGHPTIIELPSEAVIPVHVPGCPTEHLGYFILLDRFGQPLTIENSGMANLNKNGCGTGCQPGTANAAYEVLFGNGCCSSSFFGAQNDISSAGNMIFQNLFEKYLQSRMKGILGRDDLKLSRFNAIATTLFYRLLDQKETMVIFAPVTLVHYFAFAYDKKTGCGLSKLHDAAFLLSLRTTLMMAQVVAAVNDSIQHTKVEFSVDEKVANLEGVMDLMANIFIAKSKMSGSIDPAEIMRDIHSNALTIVPKNIPGLTGLDVDVSNGSSSSIKPDDQLLEQLTNLLVSHLDVPPAALNQLSEPEFARSLVTYNLFFAKKIARYQRIWCAQMTNFIRTHSSFDMDFQAAIRKTLVAHGKKRSKEKLPQETEKLRKKNVNQYNRDTESMLSAILNGVEISLPSPNIVVDKTQFEEIRAYLGNLDEIANQFFNNELVPQDDQNAQNGLTLAKAVWRRQQLMKFIENVGSFSMVEIPDMDDLDPSTLKDFIQSLQNLNAAMVQQRNAITNAEGEGGFGDSGYGGGEDDGGFGGDDFGGGGDVDMGGLDGDQRDEISEINPDEPDDATQSNASDEFEDDAAQMKSGTLAQDYYDQLKKK